VITASAAAFAGASLPQRLYRNAGW